MSNLWKISMLLEDDDVKAHTLRPRLNYLTILLGLSP